MLVVVVNKMCAMSLVVKDTVHPDVVVTCRSLIGFEAFLLLLFASLALSEISSIDRLPLHGNSALPDAAATTSIVTSITSLPWSTVFNFVGPIVLMVLPLDLARRMTWWWPVCHPSSQVARRSVRHFHGTSLQRNRPELAQ